MIQRIINFLVKLIRCGEGFVYKVNNKVFKFWVKNFLIKKKWNSGIYYWLCERCGDLFGFYGKAEKRLWPKPKHPYHIVDISPWPFFASMGVFGMAISGVMFFQYFNDAGYIFKKAIYVILSVAYLWWRDIVRESSYQGKHTLEVVRGLRYGVILFIVSEVMFFSSFFWAFFHSSLSPAIELGCVWPPIGIKVLNPWGVPLLNTAVLLLSGASITWAHHAILSNKKLETLYGIGFTIFLALFFTVLQLYEYYEAKFSISDGVYGSTFFMATGFHGFHVIIGTIFIIVCFCRNYFSHFSPFHHLGFEAAAWYWHFVDVVWLFLFISIYWWGNTLVVKYI